MKTEDKDQPVVKPIESPTGIDLNPQPEQSTRVSRRTGITIVGIGILLLLAFAYGAYRRTVKEKASSRDSGIPKSLSLV